MNLSKMKNAYKSILLCFCLCFSSVLSANATHLINMDQKQGKEMLQTFYTTYISNLLHNDKAANITLRQDYFAYELENQMEQTNQQSDTDNVLRGKTISEQMLKTLKIVPLGNNWFMVCYQQNKYIEIPVKIVQEKGKWLIQYIVPEYKGKEYGDQLLSGHEGQGITLPIDVDELKDAYANLAMHPGSAFYEKAFFEAFPKNWDEFVLTYAYLPPYDGNLYHYAWEHLEAFRNLSTIPAQEYCNRLINLCRNGYWDADGINYLQDILRTYTLQHLPFVLCNLEELKTDAFYFWQFFFQSIVKNNNDALPEYYKTIRKELVKYPKLSVEDLDMAFKVSYGRATLRGSFPSYKKNKRYR